RAAGERLRLTPRERAPPRADFASARGSTRRTRSDRRAARCGRRRSTAASSDRRASRAFYSARKRTATRRNRRTRRTRRAKCSCGSGLRGGFERCAWWRRLYTAGFTEEPMSYTYHDLKEKTIQELRDVAKGVENQDAVQGYSQLNKDHLLPALCKALGIDTHEHHAVTGIDKPAIKAKMRELRTQRAAALEAHDSLALKSVRRQIHRLNRQIRAHVAP